MRSLSLFLMFLMIAIGTPVLGQTRPATSASLDRQIVEVGKQRDQNRILMLDAALGAVEAEVDKAATAAGRGTGNYIRLKQLADMKNGPIGASARAGDAVTTAKLTAEIGRLLFLQLAREFVRVTKAPVAVAGVVGNILPQTVMAMQEWARFAALSQEDARLLRRQKSLEHQRDALPLVEDGALVTASGQLEEALILSRLLDGSPTAQQRAEAERVAKKDPEVLTAYQEVVASLDAQPIDLTNVPDRCKYKLEAVEVYQRAVVSDRRFVATLSGQAKALWTDTLEAEIRTLNGNIASLRACIAGR